MHLATFKVGREDVIIVLVLRLAAANVGAARAIKTARIELNLTARRCIVTG